MSYDIADLDDAIEDEGTEWEGSWDEFFEAAGSDQEPVLDADGVHVTKLVTYGTPPNDRSYQQHQYQDKGWKGVDIPGIGRATKVEDFGGMDLGSEYWAIFTVTDPDGNVRTFKRDGWYQSHDGGYYDGPTMEVAAKQKLVTVWEAV